MSPMKSTISLLTLLAFLVPTLTFAAFNDVTLTTSTVLSVGGYTLNVSGSSATIQSIVVNSGSFTVTMLAGSYLQVTSPTYQQLTTDNPGLVSSNSCSNSTSVLTLSSPSSSGTVTVTPTATICSTPAPSGGGGSAGGNGPIVGSITTFVAPSIATTSNTSLPQATSSISSLQNEVAALTAELNTLLSKVPATTTTASILPPSLSAPATSSIPTFFRNLALWDHGSDVTALQVFLISELNDSASAKLKAHGTTTIFGILTYYALVEFQTKAGIVPASGFFGPLTRAYVNGL
jgi:hypothetical protein